MKGVKMLLICLYVDDLLVTGSNHAEIEEFKERMKSEFDMTDLGVLSYFLGMEFLETAEGIVLHQKKYANDVLKRFNMMNCNPANTPVETKLKLEKGGNEKAIDPTLYKQMVGSLRYLCNSRPDISYGVGLISRFMDDPRQSHLVAAKRIMRYLKGTLDYGILFPKEDQGEIELIGFSDADWCGDRVDRRSTTGYMFKLSNAPISWCSKKQPVVALSSCEAEYIATSYAACQANWLDSLMKEIHIEMPGPCTAICG